MKSKTQTAPASLAMDLQDERLQDRTGLKGQFQAFLDRTRSGDLGVLPVIGGLVVIWAVLQALNPIFLSPANLVNLTMESSAVGIIALGIVSVLLVAQIDLSVGSVSGLAAAVVAVTSVNMGWPVWLVILATGALGAGTGWIYGQIFNRFGVPSFVITLAGLLGFLGLQLYILGAKGSINLPFDSPLVYFAQLAFVPIWLSYVLVAAAAAGMFATDYFHSRARRIAGLSAMSVQNVALRAVLLLVVLVVAVSYLNQSRGVGWMFILFIALTLILNYLLKRTKWGRSVYAVGGNPEAARRAGINVKAIYTSVFITCSTLAAIGGLLGAARLAAANQGSGTGDVNLNAIAAAVIGGASLFGGRGSAFAAILGIIVIQSISSGLTLLNLDSSFRFMVTGVVLLLAVTLDSVSRRSRSAHGRA
ncbi:sugar ABC transporter permease [Arthrobacter sp. MDT3-24]